MTAFWTLLGVAAVAAVVDWVAVARGDRRSEYAAKPAVLVALAAAAAVIPAGHTDLVDRRWWFVGALVCSLAGDVLLMLPRNLFVPGLAAFLVGHVLFIVGFLQPPSPPTSPPFAFSPTGIAVAAVVAANVGVATAAVGAALFVVSDAVLALGRFVRPIRHGNLAVHVTYHLAQGLLVLSLLH